VAFIFVCLFARTNIDTHAGRGKKAREKAAEFASQHPVPVHSTTAGNVKAALNSGQYIKTINNAANQ
jgi:hypothetical protein